jgi:hypothetical protein
MGKGSCAQNNKKARMQQEKGTLKIVKNKSRSY